MEQVIDRMDEEFGNDRRVEPRYASNIAADLSFVDDYTKEEAKAWAKVSSISRTGVSLVSERAIPAGTDVKLSLGASKDYPEILAQGKIVWARWLEKRKESCYGVVLLKLSEQDQEAFRHFFKEFTELAMVVERRVEERREALGDNSFLQGEKELLDNEDKKIGVDKSQRKSGRRKQLAIFKKIYDYNNRWWDKQKSQGLYFLMRTIESPSAGHCIVEGQERIMFSSNNYLGLSTHPKVVEAAINAIKEFGTSSGGPRLLGGTTKLHRLLEDKLAEFKGTESAAVFSAGFLANLALISPLLKKDDVVIIDEKDHASIIDGCKLSEAMIRVYAHNDMKDLKNKLKSYDYRKNKLIITDAVFSMDGDFAKLPEICQLAKRYKVAIAVDEAHSFGIVGENGRGVSEHFQVENQIDIFVGTFSKALAGVGGFIAGKEELISFIKHVSKPFLFAASFPPSVCATVIAALEVIKDEPERRKQLCENASFLRKGLQDIGFNTGLSESYIIPIIIGDESIVNQINGFLFQNNIIASTVHYPAVRLNGARVRLSVNATHTREDLEKTLDVFKKVYQKFGPFEVKES
ncbi:MAG: aminotransferase class I/II-fold pyridoxal phosphate-dependent enzyme [Elusimicrobiota bacterium]